MVFTAGGSPLVISNMVFANVAFSFSSASPLDWERYVCSFSSRVFRTRTHIGGDMNSGYGRCVHVSWKFFSCLVSSPDWSRTNLDFLFLLFDSNDTRRKKRKNVENAWKQVILYGDKNKWNISFAIARFFSRTFFYTCFKYCEVWMWSVDNSKKK